MNTTALRLIEARRTGRALACAGFCPANAEAAYAAQSAVAENMGWFGDAPPRYWKSGGPSREAVPTHAPLPPGGVWASPAQAQEWPFHRRGIEAEVALRLAHAVDSAQASALDLAQALARIDAMCVSIEIVDTRWAEGLDAPPLAKLADLQAHGALILGAWTPFQELDWSTQLCRVQIAERLVERRGSHSMADPCFLLGNWLRHATRKGQVVPAGTVVTTGTWVGILDAQAGDRVHAEFPGIGEACVQL